VRATRPAKSRPAKRAAKRRPAKSLAVVAIIGMLGGCSMFKAAADPGATTGPLSFDWPASSAGAACGFLDYQAVAGELGTTFDTAGGAHVNDTYTCAVTEAGHDYPDLTLSLSATNADEVVFNVTVAPDGSTAVKGLGRAAYLLAMPAAGKKGPILEYGWLSAKPRLVMVRYTFAPGASAAEVDAMKPKLLTLAQRVEKTS